MFMAKIWNQKTQSPFKRTYLSSGLTRPQKSQGHMLHVHYLNSLVSSSVCDVPAEVEGRKKFWGTNVKPTWSRMYKELFPIWFTVLISDMDSLSILKSFSQIAFLSLWNLMAIFLWLLYYCWSIFMRSAFLVHQNKSSLSEKPLSSSDEWGLKII